MTFGSLIELPASLVTDLISTFALSFMGLMTRKDTVRIAKYSTILTNVIIPLVVHGA